jgi:hypothetical protein
MQKTVYLEYAKKRLFFAFFLSQTAQNMLRAAARALRVFTLFFVPGRAERNLPRPAAARTAPNAR